MPARIAQLLAAAIKRARQLGDRGRNRRAGHLRQARPLEPRGPFHLRADDAAGAFILTEASSSSCGSWARSEPERSSITGDAETPAFADQKGLLVERDELADRAGEARVVSRSERIAASYVLEARHKDRKAKRIEPRLGKGKVVRERRQFSILLGGHSANFVQYLFSQ